MITKIISKVKNLWKRKSKSKIFNEKIEDIIEVDADIPEKNMFILKNLYPDATIIKTPKDTNNLKK